MGRGKFAARVLAGSELPARLADLEAPPERLYLHGTLPRGPMVALVGTRRSSQAGIEFTRALAAELATQGVAILSGGAEGIDTAAHTGALDAGGATVVMAPAGIARPFPKQNAALFRRVIAEGGAYLSLAPADAPATSGVFFLRNACLVALAHAVVVTETPCRSGARNAAKWARELGRPLFVVPHSPWHEPGLGAAEELRLGARPLVRARDVLRLLEAQGLHSLGLPPPGESEQGPLPVPAEGTDPVLAALRSGADHADAIAELTGLPLAAVQRRILTLALSGVLVPGPWGSVKLISS